MAWQYPDSEKELVSPAEATRKARRRDANLRMQAEETRQARLNHLTKEIENALSINYGIKPGPVRISERWLQNEAYPTMSESIVCDLIPEVLERFRKSGWSVTEEAYYVKEKRFFLWPKRVKKIRYLFDKDGSFVMRSRPAAEL